MNRKAYNSDLTDSEWAILAPLIPPALPGGRPRKHDMREVLDAIFYISRGGCAWRLLPHEFSPWQTVYHYFRAWREAGLWEQIHGVLRGRARESVGREAQPGACIIDWQSVKTTERGGVHGDDGGKKIGGRKRHILVDTTGLVLKAIVHSGILSSSTHNAIGDRPAQRHAGAVFEHHLDMQGPLAPDVDRALDRVRAD
jgi:transposase